MTDESVIDFPKEGLCPDVWEKVIGQDGVNETWQLRQDVRQQVQQLYDQLRAAVKAELDVVHITGSITSNSYTENADIDMHFLASSFEGSDEEAEALNKQLREAYAEKVFIAKHPIEVYFQPSKFQDLMSVGCYDFFSGKWLVGPELTSRDFNPYKEYYAEVQAKSEELAKQIRNIVFSIYEIAVVYKKNIDTDYAQSVRPILVSKLAEVQKLYDSIRAMRKVYSSPQSEEEALKFRSSRKWKVADAAFKLFDKYGYMAIMKQFIEDYKLIAGSEAVDEEIVEDILQTVKNYISNAEKLAEKELYEDEQLDEGAVANIAIAALLAIPGLLPQEALAKELSKVPKQEMRLNSKPVKAAVQNAAVEKQSFNGLSFVNLTNLVATIAYNEAMLDYVKTGDAKVIYAVCQSISNRSGGDPKNFAAEISRKSQYFSFKHVKGGLKDADYKMYDPRSEGPISKKQKECWALCNTAAVMAIKGTLPNVIGDRNMLANQKIDKASAWNSWGKDCDLKVGTQYYGYRKDQDGYRKYKIKKPAHLNHLPAAKTYVVKKGDTLWSIAKSNNTTVAKLVAANKLTSKDMIQIGQKLKV